MSGEPTTGETSGFHAHTCPFADRQRSGPGVCVSRGSAHHIGPVSDEWLSRGVGTRWTAAKRAAQNHRIGSEELPGWKRRINARDRGLVGAELAATPTR
jgi:hypothetical protein